MLVDDVFVTFVCSFHCAYTSDIQWAC